jgi:hypothetical protein
MAKSEMPLIAGKLSYWKAKRIKRLILCKPPEAPDVTQSVAVAACSEAGDRLLATVSSWPIESDSASFCQKLLERVPGRRLHLFAKANKPGWESIIGDRNWSTPETTT